MDDELLAVVARLGFSTVLKQMQEHAKACIEECPEEGELWEYVEGHLDLALREAEGMESAGNGRDD